jgi:hypothetical protein
MSGNHPSAKTVDLDSDPVFRAEELPPRVFRVAGCHERGDALVNHPVDELGINAKAADVGFLALSEDVRSSDADHAGAS